MTSTSLPTIAVAGCGHWGKNLVRNFADLGALAAVSDPNTILAKQFGEQHGVPALSWQEVLDSDVQSVAISAPAALHGRLATEALKAGKHVYVEKPLALDLDEAQAACDLAEANNLTLMVGHLLQYHPVFLELKSLVARGALGKLEYLYSNRLNLGRFRREENILWSFAPHDISMILSLVGEEPDEVEAIGSFFLHKSIADVTTTHLVFPGGQHAHIFVSWLHPYKEQKLVVVGSEGMAVFDDREPWESKLRLYPHQISWAEGQPVPHRADSQKVHVEEAEPLQAECLHFLESVRGGTVPRTDGQEGLRVLRVLQEAQRSLNQRRRSDGVPSEDAQPRTGPPARDAFVHESAYVDEGVQLGSGTKVWHFSHLLSGTSVGSNCSIGQNVMIGPDVSVGDGCKIQNNVSLYKGVQLANDVFCGPSSVFTNVINPRADVERKDEFRATPVGEGATIGANATIVCGHAIGHHALIGAGAVVTTDVPPFALMVGVPARRVGWVSHSGERLGADMVCPRSGRRYVETGPDTLEETT